MGPEHLLVDALLMGGHGGVNGGAQVDPNLLVGLYNAARSGDVAKVKALQERLAILGKIYGVGQYGSTVIKGMKCALSLIGICDDELAPPMARFDPPEREKIRKVLEQLVLIPNLVRKPEEAMS